jgi:hypothetical protein
MKRNNLKFFFISGIALPLHYSWMVSVAMLNETLTLTQEGMLRTKGMTRSSSVFLIPLPGDS